MTTTPTTNDTPRPVNSPEHISDTGQSAQDTFDTVSELDDPNPVVSVVVPTYNRADGLAVTIESVLAQTLTEFELIIVDDSSTDDTETVVSQYDDDRITYIRHEHNRGGSAARNTGIDTARGKYVALLDSDDVWAPEKLERQIALLESRSDEWVAAYCGFERQRTGANSRLRALFDAVLPPSERPGIEGGEELVAESLLLRGFSTGGSSTLLVRRDVVKRMGGFDESFERQQDWEFRNRVVREGKLAYVDEVLMTKRESNAPAAETVERSISHYLDTFSTEVRTLEDAGYDVTGRHLYLISCAFFSEGKFREGLYYLRRSHLPTIRQYAEVGYAALRGVRTLVRRER